MTAESWSGGRKWYELSDSEAQQYFADKKRAVESARYDFAEKRRHGYCGDFWSFYHANKAKYEGSACSTAEQEAWVR